MPLITPRWVTVEPHPSRDGSRGAREVTRPGTYRGWGLGQAGDERLQDLWRIRAQPRCDPREVSGGDRSILG